MINKDFVPKKNHRKFLPHIPGEETSRKKDPNIVFYLKKLICNLSTIVKLNPFLETVISLYIVDQN